MLLLTAAMLFAPHYEVTHANDVRNAVAGPNGGIYFTSFDVNGANPEIVSLDPEGRPLYQVSPHPAGSTVASFGPLAADSQGNVYVLTAAMGGNSAQQCLLTKVDPNGATVYAFSLPQQPAICFGQSSAVALALGPDGSVFLAGSVSPQSMSTTSGAVVTASAAAPNQINAYVVRVNPQGTAVIYSTFLDSSPQRSQVSPLPTTTALALAVDSQSNAYIAGTTQDPTFPTSPGALFAACNCVGGAQNIFVMKLTANGGQIGYSTFLRPTPLASNASSPLLNITVDSASNATVMQLPPTAGASSAAAAISMMTIDNSGAEALNSSSITFAGGSPSGVMPDGQGNLLLTGTNPGSLTLSPGAFTNGSNFAAIVRVADSSVVYATALPNGSAQSILPDGSGGFLTIGALVGNYPNRATQITRFIPASSAAPAVLGVTNVAGLAVSPGLAPGELVSIYGVNLGPTAGVAGAFDSTGTLPYNLAETAVYFNGVPAPLLYAGSQQVNAIVPFGVPGGAAMSVTVTVNGTLGNTAILPERAADPEIFKAGDGGVFQSTYADSFALNQDGSINSAQNPANPGTVLTLFVSGTGLMSPNPVDGRVGGIGPQVFLPLTATALLSQAGGNCCANANMQILYAGSAPTLAAGMVQLNLQLPSGLTGLNSGAQQAGLTLVLGTPGGTIPSDFIANGAVWISPGN